MNPYCSIGKSEMSAISIELALISHPVYQNVEKEKKIFHNSNVPWTEKVRAKLNAKFRTEDASNDMP